MHVDMRLTAVMNHIRLHVPVRGRPWYHVTHHALGSSHLRLVWDPMVPSQVHPLMVARQMLGVYILVPTSHLYLAHTHVGGLVGHHPPHCHPTPIHPIVVRGRHAWVDSHRVWLIRHSNRQGARHAPSSSTSPVTRGSHPNLLSGHMWPSHCTQLVG